MRFEELPLATRQEVVDLMTASCDARQGLGRAAAVYGVAVLLGEGDPEVVGRRLRVHARAVARRAREFKVDLGQVLDAYLTWRERQGQLDPLYQAVARLLAVAAGFETSFGAADLKEAALTVGKAVLERSKD